MLTWLKEKLAMHYLTALIRHGLTALGTLMLTKGIGDAQTISTWVDLTTQISLGAASVAVSLVLSWIEKARREK